METTRYAKDESIHTQKSPHHTDILPRDFYQQGPDSGGFISKPYAQYVHQHISIYKYIDTDIFVCKCMRAHMYVIYIMRESQYGCWSFASRKYLLYLL